MALKNKKSVFRSVHFYLETNYLNKQRYCPPIILPLELCGSYTIVVVVKAETEKVRNTNSIFSHFTGEAQGCVEKKGLCASYNVILIKLGILKHLGNLYAFSTYYTTKVKDLNYSVDS